MFRTLIQHQSRAMRMHSKGMMMPFQASSSLLHTPVRSMSYEPVKPNNRPTSPHVTIYKFPLPAISSITNRVTGSALSVGVLGMGLGQLTGMDIAHTVEVIKDIPIILPVVKFSVAFPLVYHYLGGLRHLYWDKTAAGLTLDAVNSSSAILFGASIVTSGGLALATF